MLRWLVICFLVPAPPAMAQGMRMAPPDHWITADSLAKAVGGDATVAQKAAPHLAEVDKVMKQAAEERSRMFAGGRPDQATMQGFRAKAQVWQTSLDEHLTMIREGLDERQRAAFDALQKPQVMMRGGRGMGERR
jgi:hypothetical protein